MSDPADLSASGIAAAVRERKLSRREVVEAHAARIEARNGELNALVELRLEAALAEADARDAEGGIHGPLDGVPMSVKENYDVGGMATTVGLPSRADLVAERDELSVRRLREAGALVLGRGNMPDMAIRWNTISSLHGATRNPRDPALSVGGSTGGDAAAVASHMVAAGLGSDAGGSLRVPATWCGVLGFRPTTGLVARVPELPPHDFPPSYDLMAAGGTVARAAEDLELTFDVLRGAAPGDPASVPVEPFPAGERGRVALVMEETGAALDPEVLAAVEDTAERLRAAGYEVEAGVAPDLRRAPELFAQIVGTELMQHRLRPMRHLLGESALQHIEALYGQFDLGPRVDRYLAALHKRRALARSVAAWMEDYPLVLAPVAGMAPPPLEYDHMLSLEDTMELFDRMRSVVWVNLLGLPAAALGNGAQLIGPRFGDRAVLAAARHAA